MHTARIYCWLVARCSFFTDCRSCWQLKRARRGTPASPPRFVVEESRAHQLAHGRPLFQSVPRRATFVSSFAISTRVTSLESRGSFLKIDPPRQVAEERRRTPVDGKFLRRFTRELSVKFGFCTTIYYAAMTVKDLSRSDTLIPAAVIFRFIHLPALLLLLNITSPSCVPEFEIFRDIGART